MDSEKILMTVRGEAVRAGKAPANPPQPKQPPADARRTSEQASSVLWAAARTPDQANQVQVSWCPAAGQST